jgi:hypothetical protein
MLARAALRGRSFVFPGSALFTRSVLLIQYTCRVGFSFKFRTNLI